MRFVLWVVGALWAAIGAWYLYRTASTGGVDAMGYPLVMGMLMYIFPGLVLMGLGSLIGRRARKTVVEHVHVTAAPPAGGAMPAAAAGTGAAAAAAAGRHPVADHHHAAAHLHGGTVAERAGTADMHGSTVTHVPAAHQGSTMTHAPAAHQGSTAARLDELQALRAQGRIDQGEYERRRAEILRGI